MAIFTVALTAGWIAPAAVAAPTLTADIPDIELYSGYSIIGVANLSRHFDLPNPGAVSFSVEPVTTQVPDQSGHIVLRVSGLSLEVVAGATDWAGNGSFRVLACEGADCTPSNTFEVRVFAPPFGRNDVNPPGFEIDTSTGSDLVPLGSTVEFALGGERAANASVPTWFLDGEPIGTGPSISFPAPGEGNHTMRAQFDADGQTYNVVRLFTVGGPATPGVNIWAWGGGLMEVITALVSAAAVAAMVGSARMRRPFVLAYVSGIYPRLQPVSLLDHFSRGTLYQAIKENPGIHFSELARKTSMSRGRAAHHLRVMERAGLIRCEFVGAYTRYVTDSEPPIDDDYGLSSTEREVLRTVVERPGIFQAELVDSVARSAGTVSRAVKRLAGYGFVTPRREQRQRRVYPGPRDIPPALLGRPEAEAGPAKPLNSPQ